MVKFMKKFSGGLFVVPMILSAVFYTLWPNLFNLGGITEAFFSGAGTTFLIGMVTFISGININLPDLVVLLKRHGVIMLAKLLLVIPISLLYIYFFGQEGLFGITALAFTVAISSMNPSLYLSLVNDSGTEIDSAAFGFTALFSIPALPVFVYSIVGGGGMDWIPVLSTIIPFFVGILLGNLDKEFKTIFNNGMNVTLPLLGWNIGQGLNLIEGLRSGISGIVLVIIFYLINLLLIVVDMKLLNNDGIAAASMVAVSGTSASFPAVIALSNPLLSGIVGEATAQVLIASIITVVLTPMLVDRLAKRKKQTGEVSG